MLTSDGGRISLWQTLARLGNQDFDPWPVCLYLCDIFACTSMADGSLLFPPGLAGSALYLHIRPNAAKITQWNYCYCTRGFSTLISKSGTSAGCTVWWPLVLVDVWGKGVCRRSMWRWAGGSLSNWADCKPHQWVTVNAALHFFFFLISNNKTSNYHSTNHLLVFTSKSNN